MGPEAEPDQLGRGAFESSQASCERRSYTIMRKAALIPSRWLKRTPYLPIALGVSVGIAACVLLGVIPATSGPERTASISSSRTTIKSSAITSSDATLLYDAEQRLIQDCMHRHGFSYWITPMVKSQEHSVLQFPYVVDDVAWARRNGFGGGTASTAQPDPNWRYFYMTLPISLRADYMTALSGAEGSPGIQVTLPNGIALGHSKSGCMAAADAELYGNYVAWFEAVNFVDSLEPLSQIQALNDPKYALAVRHWSQCIHAYGYAYPTPSSLAHAFNASPGPHSRATGRASINAAVAEARCAIRTGLANTARRLANSYFSTILEKYSKEVQAYRRLQLAAIPRAHKIMVDKNNG
jgi:hypothetical protein